MLITGASGMLGKALSKSFPEATLLNGKQDLDLRIYLTQKNI